MSPGIQDERGEEQALEELEVKAIASRGMYESLKLFIQHYLALAKHLVPISANCLIAHKHKDLSAWHGDIGKVSFIAFKNHREHAK